MNLIDTSAWIEYLRGTGSKADAAVTGLIQESAPIVITEPVIMELLAGARDAGNFRRLLTMTGGLPLMAVDAGSDYHEAAAIYRLARMGGKTIRSMADCLIAAVGLRRDATVVHFDADFDVIASCVPLRTQSLL
jgi:predicted nucleic acid-binding protein